MKRYLIIFVFVTLTCCKDSINANQETINEQKHDSSSITEQITSVSKLDSIQEVNNERVDYQLKELSSEFRYFRLVDLKEAIVEDLNGDGIADKAMFIFKNGKGGIVITDGKSQQEVKIGLGIAFEEMGDDFSWVDYWGIVKDSTTYGVIIIDSEIIGDTIVRLENPSIFVRKEEVGGGIITFRNGKYEWIHQAD